MTTRQKKNCTYSCHKNEKKTVQRLGASQDLHATKLTPIPNSNPNPSTLPNPNPNPTDLNPKP